MRQLGLGRVHDEEHHSRVTAITEQTRHNCHTTGGSEN